jgi:hypothetical protein
MRSFNQVIHLAVICLILILIVKNYFSPEFIWTDFRSIFIYPHKQQSCKLSFDPTPTNVIRLKLVSMKKISLISLAGIFIMSLGFTAKGQDAISKIQPITTAINVDRNDINVNALRHFARNFNDASSEKWYATTDLVVALFSLREIDYRVDYNIRNGNWIETFRTYSEAKMSADLKQSVKSSYHEYSIFQVQEIEQPLHPLNYIVHLEGKTRLINLRIYDGEMREEQNYKQSQ